MNTTLRESSNSEDKIADYFESAKRGTGTPEQERVKRAKLIRELGVLDQAANTHKSNFEMYSKMGMDDEAKVLAAIMKKKSTKAKEHAELANN